MPTKKEILDELNNFVERYPPRQDNDVTVMDIMNDRKISHTRAIEVMKKAVREYPDVFEMVKVKSEMSGWMWVLRSK